MAQVIEISDIGNGAPVISLNKDGGSSSNDASSAISAPSGSANLKSVNFGGGLDLLMNDKKSKSKSSGAGTDINLEDLKELEDDLNNLSADIGGVEPRASGIKAKSKSGLFKSALGGSDGIKLNISDKASNSADGSSSSESIKIGKPLLGKQTAQTGVSGDGGHRAALRSHARNSSKESKTMLFITLPMNISRGFSASSRLPFVRSGEPGS